MTVGYFEPFESFYTNILRKSTSMISALASGTLKLLQETYLLHGDNSVQA